MSRERAQADLHTLLDRYEGNPAASRVVLRIDASSFPSRRALDDYLSALESAAVNGAVQITPRRGRARNDPPIVRIGRAGALYAYLGRRPSGEAASDALSALFKEPPIDWKAAALGEIREHWARRREWYGVLPGDTGRLANVVAIAEALVGNRHEGQDYRSLSAAVVGNSKFLERNEPAVARFVSFGRTLAPGHPRVALSSIGLDRIAMPLHLAGPLTLGGHPLPDALPYLAIPHGSVAEIGFAWTPRLLLTIENFVSFHRHALEANPGRHDLIIYTSGQPSLSWHGAVKALRARLPPDIGAYHWSDIDAGGLEIFRTLERSFGAVRPHLMSIDLAERLGTLPPAPIVRTGQFEGSAIASLAEYLASPSGRCLEQELIDPQPPDQ